MTTDNLSDDRLYAMLRAADPLASEPERPAADTEAALARLLAGESPSRASTGRDLRTPRRQMPRWWAVRLMPVAAAAAVAVALLGALPSGGPVTVPAASAKGILARAASVVAGSAGAILHADISATQVWQDGSTDHWTEQDWQQVSSPYDGRSIDTDIWPTSVETAYVHGEMWLYDPSTNTIYTNQPPPPFTLSPGAQPGTYALRAGDGSTGPSLIINATQAAALRDGTDIWADDGSGGLMVIPRPTTGPQTLSEFRPEALALLHSPTAKVTSNVTIDGQSALEVTSSDGTLTYYLNPTSYAPIQMTRPVPNTGVTGDSAKVTLTFTHWQYLTGTAADPALISLAAQHPNAALDSSAADYDAVANRLFP